MVSYSEGGSSAPAPSLLASGLKTFEVLVPVYLKVAVVAEDDLAAEMLALDAVRSLADRQLEVGSATVGFKTLISAVVNPAH